MSDEQIPAAESAEPTSEASAEAEAPAEEAPVVVDAAPPADEPEAEPAEEAPASQSDDVSEANTDPITPEPAEEGGAVKEVSHPYEPAHVLAGVKRISRVLLDEIEQRRAVADIELLLAACNGLLDELEGKEQS